jgi:lipopolysaccharide/colanic/teichoic acid biosynthesis glycosyltransferase
MKRAFDFVLALSVLLVLSPLLVLIAAAIFAYDRHSPFYRALRVGKDGQEFAMLKFRSMLVDADRSGVMSTAANDRRITPIGHFIRRFKLDELSQFYNVVAGDMSLVGPRPNVRSGVALYTEAERELLRVRPGITDLASIVFADEGEILRNHSDADIAYDRLIRPWKSRLGLFYIEHASWRLDIEIMALTAIGLVSRSVALRGVSKILDSLGAPKPLVEASLREAELSPSLPPGAE